MSKETQPFSDQCEHILYQQASIHLPIALIPEVSVGEIKIKTEQAPQVEIRTNKSSGCRHRCELSITQTITYKIPIQYRAKTDIGDVCSACLDLPDRRHCD